MPAGACVLPHRFVHAPECAQARRGTLPSSKAQPVCGPKKVGDSCLSGLGVLLETKAIVYTIVFLIAMYGCESWTVKKANRGKNLICFKYDANVTDCKKDEHEREHRFQIKSTLNALHESMSGSCLFKQVTFRTVLEHCVA